MDIIGWLESVTQAARIVDSEARWVEAQREAVMRFGTPTGVHTGIHDPMRPVDALVDAEATRRERIGHALDEVEQARAVFAGMRSIGWMECEAASILELVHINLTTKKDAGSMMHMSYDTAKRRYRYGVEWLEAHGLAHAKAGTGLAT